MRRNEQRQQTVEVEFEVGSRLIKELDLVDRFPLLPWFPFSVGNAYEWSDGKHNDNNIYLVLVYPRLMTKKRSVACRFCFVFNTLS